ncbi:MAG: TlpA family protein disulfide reductase [Candidatus Hydrogenedentes bacterium]|nr:TlpA family protein disulfide reductase [Candidatus Hydrogenedentota bacterium]
MRHQAGKLMRGTLLEFGLRVSPGKAWRAAFVLVVALCAVGCGQAPAPQADTDEHGLARTDTDVAARAQGAEEPAPAQATPAPKAADAALGDVTVADEQALRGLLAQMEGKVLVVNLWATYCLPCIAEMPIFKELYRARDPEAVAFLSLSADAEYSIDEAVKPFMKDHALPFPVQVISAVDPKVLKQLIGAESTTWDGELPATFVLDRDRKLVKHWLEEVKPGELEETIKPLLASASAPA